MTTIYLVRHAEAEGNLCRRIHGQYDTNVTPNGLAQIRDLRKRFASVTVDACYSSDLTRTQNTAQAICVPKGLELHTSPAFREVGIGVWEDQPFGYLNTFETESIQHFNRNPVVWCVEGSETFDQYTGRFLKALEEIVRTHEGQSVAIVSHGAVLRGVLSVLFPEMEVGHSDNTAVTCLQYDNGAYTVAYLNDNSHLSSGSSTFARQKWWQQDGAQGDDTLWFRAGNTEVEGVTAPHSPIVYTALENDRPVGVVCLSEEGADARIDYVGLVSSYRGYSLAVQLLGQAIFTVRPMGKKKLRIQIPEDCPALEAACRKLDFVQERAGSFVMDLALRIKPLE